MIFKNYFSVREDSRAVNSDSDESEDEGDEHIRIPFPKDIILALMTLRTAARLYEDNFDTHNNYDILYILH